MTFVIGVDGGGTRTRAVLVDEAGVELGRAEAEGAVVTRERPGLAVHAVTTAVRAAAQNASVPLPAAAIWAGLAGAGQAAARTAVLAALLKADVARVVHIGTDVEAAFQDAFAGGPGILLIAGTGSIAWARTADGRRLRVGGWGERLGDEGSGYRIGLQALQALVRCEDGRGPETALSDPVLAHCGVDHARGLIGWIETASKGEVASIAPLVGVAASGGDPTAVAIIEEAATELDAHVGALLDRIGRMDEPPPLALWGGLLAGSGPLREVVTEAVRRRPVSLVEAEIDPPAGAASLARALL